MTNALAYITGFSTGKKLPHDGAKRLQSAAPGL